MKKEANLQNLTLVEAVGRAALHRGFQFVCALDASAVGMNFAECGRLFRLSTVEMQPFFCFFDECERLCG